MPEDDIIGKHIFLFYRNFYKKLLGCCFFNRYLLYVLLICIKFDDFNSKLINLKLRHCKCLFL